MSIHATAIISPEAKVGRNAQIGAFTQIHRNVVLGDNTRIGAYCELGLETPLSDGSPLIIGNDSFIRSQSIFYESSIFGDNLVTGHGVSVRERTVAGVNFQIGSHSEIQGDTHIGDYVRFQSNIFVGKNTLIEDFVWLFPYVILTNDPTPPSDTLIGPILRRFVSVAANSVVMPGVEIGEGSVVGANSCVTRNVNPGLLVRGSPAQIIGEASIVKLRDCPGQSAYPWRKHFHRGYPEHIVEVWKRDE